MILSPKHLPRLIATVKLFTSYGLRDFANRQGLLGLEGAALDDETPVDGDAAVKAKAFRERLVELGPAYIKLGQVLSTRPDLLPKPYIDELEHLQDDVPPMPFETVEATIEVELHARISKLFASFSEEPLGSASLGQVHAAELRDGRSVVVKVQRPNLREQLSDDIEFFHEMASFLTEHTSAGSRIDLVGVVQQVERALVDELDYRTEARNAASFRKVLAKFPHILIPRVIDAYTTHRVLTTERIKGVKIDEIPPITRIEYEFADLADEFAHAYLEQITNSGHFHADPHPGNVFIVLPGPDNPRTPAEALARDRRSEVRPGATALVESENEARAAAVASDAAPDDPKLALIDFGMTAHLTASMRDKVVRLLLAMAENNGDAAAETLIEMGQAPDEFDRRAYTRDVAELIAKHTNQTVEDTPAGVVLYEMITIAFREGLKLPAELTLLAKALFNLDAVTRSLDPNFNPSQSIREYTAEIANKRAQRDMSPRRLFQMASETSDLVRALPHRLDVITQKLVADDFAFRVEAPQLGSLLLGLEKVANRIFTGLVLGGLLVASGYMIQVQRRLATAGFIIAGAIGLWMIATILIQDRRSRRRKGKT
ncbi:MAG TPA: AarF/UbiB family protein [Gemmatimonadaceae bacterium]|jgi:predicted unusual protein kinase regulating ubiquinone biosynthesis (AarF/ABC1/UbiB family)|nr:AarF/UbiB family protein [Gemmatimonadaceae bacterium]